MPDSKRNLGSAISAMSRKDALLLTRRKTCDFVFDKKQASEARQMFKYALNLHKFAVMHNEPHLIALAGEISTNASSKMRESVSMIGRN